MDTQNQLIQNVIEWRDQDADNRHVILMATDSTEGTVSGCLVGNNARIANSLLAYARIDRDTADIFIAVAKLLEKMEQEEAEAKTGEETKEIHQDKES